MSDDFWRDEAPGESVWRPWDKLILGGITFPGVVKITCAIGVGIDVNKYLKKRGTATEPAQFRITLTDRGYEPGTVRAEVEIWDADQWEDLKETLPKFTPRTGDFQGSDIVGATSADGTVTNQAAKRSDNIKGRDAFDIVHPTTRLLGVDSVVIKGISVPHVENGCLKFTIDMIEYFEPSSYPRTLHGGAGSNDALFVDPVDSNP